MKSKMLKRVFRYLAIVVAIVLAIEFCVILFAGSNPFLPTVSFVSPTDYTALFNDSAKSELSLRVTNLIKGRPPIAQYIYDHRLSVIVCKFRVPPSGSLLSVLSQNVENVRLPFGHQYCTVTLGKLRVSYACDSVGIVKKIIFTYYGDSAMRLFKSENMITFKMYLSNLYIQYDNKGKPDIEIGPGRGNRGKIPINGAFIRQENSVYFVLISPLAQDDLDVTDISNMLLKKL
jgi:hypothetical protein